MEVLGFVGNHMRFDMVFVGPPASEAPLVTQAHLGGVFRLPEALPAAA